LAQINTLRRKQSRVQLIASAHSMDVIDQ